MLLLRSERIGVDYSSTVISFFNGCADPHSFLLLTPRFDLGVRL